MGRKITLNIKIRSCPFCVNADKAKLRQLRPNYCKVGFKAKNGHCENFTKEK